jgi:hypothetical protein
MVCLQWKPVEQLLDGCRDSEYASRCPLWLPWALLAIFFAFVGMRHHWDVGAAIGVIVVKVRDALLGGAALA